MNQDEVGYGRTMRWFVVMLGMLAGLAFAAPASAAPPEPFGHRCTAENGVRFCPTRTDAERVPSFDGIPLDVDVTLPATGDGPFPTVVMLHGFGGSKTDMERDNPEASESDDQADQFQEDDEDSDDILFHYNNNFYAKQGYAVVNYTARGFGRSCGQEPRSPPAPDACDTGYLHLADSRFEVRDSQFLLGRLVDQGVTRPDAIAVTGISYGGGQSIQLAKLRNQIRNRDGSLSRWVSPQKKIPLEISAAYPRWPWSDLVYALLPNGRFLDFEPSELTESREPIGVLLESYVTGLFALGTARGYVCGDAPGSTPCTDPSADLNQDFAVVQAGEPYSGDSRGRLDEIFAFHQGFGLRPPVTPAPLLVENGWTDDLFPADQAVRIFDEVRAQNPGAEVSLQLGDLGHSRGANKKNTDRFFNDQAAAFFAKHFGQRPAGTGAPPEPGSVYAFTQTCPEDAPGEGPFSAESFLALSPGAVRFSSGAGQTVTSPGGDPTTGVAFDPVAGGGEACEQVREETSPGRAEYRLRADRDFTLLGRPTVRATIATTQAAPGDVGQLDSRLLDVSPDGQQRLITRGAYRLTQNQSGTITFQLNGNGYRFAKGHTVKLELRGQDAPYLRPSNVPFTVRVADVTVELPTREAPDGGQITGPLIGEPAAASRPETGQSGSGSGARSGGDRRSRTPRRPVAADARRRAATARSIDASGDRPAASGAASDRSDGELPFTGLVLAPAAVLGLGLLSAGIALRRRSRGHRATDDAQA